MPTDLLDTSAIASAMALVDAGPAPIDAVALLVMLDGAMNQLAGYRAQVVEIARQASLVTPGEGTAFTDAADNLLGQRSFRAEIAAALKISERGTRSRATNGKL